MDNSIKTPEQKGKVMITNYRKAWNDWRKTDVYKDTIEAMKKQGIKFRYANNILHCAFAAGWGDKKIIELKP